MDKQTVISKNLYKRSLLSYLLYPLSLLYASIQILHRIYYKLFPGLVYHCPIPVLCVGNIVSGGSGKTPFAVFLVKHLEKAGKKVAVSHRDYLGNYEAANEFLSNRQGFLPAINDACDEAALLAEKLPGTPVIAGKNRKKSLMLLIEKYPDLDYIVLDDSFQHLKVYHDYDFIMFQSSAGYGNGFVLPAGILREPLSALKGADYIVWNGNQPLPEKLLSYGKPILRGNSVNCGLRDMKGNTVSVEVLKEKKLALISGIGFPKGFEDTILGMGLKFVFHYKMKDHYDYSNKMFIHHLKREMLDGKYDYLVTTEKDYVKLRKLQHHFPLMILAIEFVPDEDALQYLNQLI